MKNLLVLLIFFCSSALMSGQAQSVSLSLDPSPQNVGPGSIAFVMVNISGLTAGGPPSLGAFDFDVSFNPNLLSFQSVVFGPFLGNEALGEAIVNVDTAIPGIIGLNEISLLESNSTTCVFCIGPFLDDLQQDMFPLATLGFGTSSNFGNSTSEFSQAVLSDALGTVLSVTSTSSVAINIVPELSTMVLLMTGLIFLAGSRWSYSGRKRTLVE